MAIITKELFKFICIVHELILSLSLYVINFWECNFYVESFLSLTCLPLIFVTSHCSLVYVFFTSEIHGKCFVIQGLCKKRNKNKRVLNIKTEKKIFLFLT